MLSQAEVRFLKNLGIETEGKSIQEIREELYRLLDGILKKEKGEDRERASLEECGLSGLLSLTSPLRPPQELLESLKSFFASDRCFFILRGGVGLNKTRYLAHVGLSLYNSVLKRLRSKFPDRECFPSYKELYFLSWTRFLAELDDFENRQWKRTLDRAVETKVLIVDDFLSGFLSPYRINQVWILINERYGSGKKTIISTNEDVYALRLRAEGDLLRIFDRLCDQHLSMEYVLEGKSKRLRKKPEPPASSGLRLMD